MAVDVLSDSSQLHASEANWRSLWDRTPDATPFQSPMWLLPWWRSFGSGELYVVAESEGDMLRSFAPLFVVREDDESLGMILGSGNSDYLDILGSPAAAFAQIAEIHCQMWDFQQLRSSSPLLSAPPPEGWSDIVSDHDVCPVLAIEGAGGELENLISPHFRKKLRYYRRSVARLGEVAFATVDVSTIEPAMDALFVLHAARWERRGLPGVLASDVDQRFHREASRAFLDAGLLRMHTITVDGRIVAVWYGFAAHGVVYYYLSGFDPELEKLSIGTVLVAHAIEQAVGEGARLFDFLRGAEQYKYTWGATDRLNRRRQVFPA